MEVIKKISENKRKNALEVLEAWEADLIKKDKIDKDIEQKNRNFKKNNTSMKGTEIESYPLVLTAIEIGQILKISKPSAYVLMNQADFPLISIGRCKRVLRDEFFSWLSDH